jgi:hypothetical protein
VIADHRVILASRFPNDEARRSTVVETTMDVSVWLRKQLEEASPDLLRAMVQDFAEVLMGSGGRRALRGWLRRAVTGAGQSP